MTRPFREARIDVGAIAHNTERMRRAAPTPHFMAVVKADGYGHGAAAGRRTSRGSQRAALAGPRPASREQWRRLLAQSSSPLRR